jgi:hypothetical protein
MGNVAIHDVGFVLTFVALAVAPRAIATYLAVRK